MITNDLNQIETIELNLKIKKITLYFMRMLKFDQFVTKRIKLKQIQIFFLLKHRISSTALNRPRLGL